MNFRYLRGFSRFQRLIKGIYGPMKGYLGTYMFHSIWLARGEKSVLNFKVKIM